MKYKLLKDLPGVSAGKEFITSNLQFTYSRGDGVLLVGPQFALDHPDFFEPIIEKKTYDDLKTSDTVYHIIPYSDIKESVFMQDCSRSETFLTREEAEDEHKRREFSVRPDKFIPDFKEMYFHPRTDGSVNSNRNHMLSEDANNINLGLCFRTREDCEKAIKEHDLIRLFYTIR